MDAIDPDLLWLAAVPGFIAFVYYLQDVTLLWSLGALFLIIIAYHMIQRILSHFKLDNLEKRAVFITGCDTGFGNLLALKCLQRDMPVFAGCLTEKGASALREASSSLPGKLDTIIVDVASDDSVAAAAKYLEKATRQYGVNNAGIVGASFYDDMLTLQHYKEVVDVNTYGVIRVTHALKNLVKRTRGRIVTIASICARIGIEGIGPYTVSKYAATGYCEVIRQELRHFGVTVHILEPGFFNTPLIDEKLVQARLDAVWKSTPDSVKEEYGESFFREGRERATSMLHMIARFPHMRYQIGADAKYLFVPMAYLPTGLRDAIAKAIGKVMGAPVPACSKKGDELIKETNPLKMN
ncbi:hypothetical protein PRIPAC_78325 [Pristionchus pacificus]|uniref:Dehydrogenase n=1 Tax=Pristionchus pacificus TaxID=54126 RepID=A0A2A6CMC5_PRIPA|nr:hypothetical protein PRIPAC_78325 [Pristionchus pacificus]|eukprot:PDM79256.1 dehydrogenase [Pristionchus pacificus]